MNSPTPGLPALPYPLVQNNIANDPTPKDQAIYVPSVTPGFAKDVYADRQRRPMPKGLQWKDLNFLDPNNSLFRISHVMSSAGQALNQNRDCIITMRDPASTKLICDSGGYQIAHNRMQIRGDEDRRKILDWMERHGDYAMTLDVPCGPVLTDSYYSWSTTEDCLKATLEHLDFFKRERKPGKVNLLNVLQGNDHAEGDMWYDAVKNYPFEGWAFAGIMRQNIGYLCRRILFMADQGKIQDKCWIHVLGTCELETAVLLTALQRAINDHINPNLRISFDTSSAFRQVGWKTAYTLPNITAAEMTMPMRKAPDDEQFIGSDLRWPWPSPLGDRMALRDFCVRKPVTDETGTYLDAQSYHYLAHHNLAALCWGVALANRVFDAESLTKDSFAKTIGKGVRAVHDVIKAGDMTTLAKHEETFLRLRHGAAYDTGDDQRLFEDQASFDDPV